MSKEELIAIGYKIANAEGTEAELDDLYALFSKNVPHSAGQIFSSIPKTTTQAGIISAIMILLWRKWLISA